MITNAINPYKSTRPLVAKKSQPAVQNLDFGRSLTPLPKLPKDFNIPKNLLLSNNRPKLLLGFEPTPIDYSLKRGGKVEGTGHLRQIRQHIIEQVKAGKLLFQDRPIQNSLGTNLMEFANPGNLDGERVKIRFGIPLYRQETKLNFILEHRLENGEIRIYRSPELKDMVKSLVDLLPQESPEARLIRQNWNKKG